MKQIIFILALIFFGSINTYAQSNLSGLVIDRETNKPISYVNIYILNTTKGTVTNSEGFFKLAIGSNKEEKSVLFSALGYKSLVINLSDLVNKDGLKFEMVAAINKLDAVLLLTEPKYSVEELVQKALSKHIAQSDKSFLAKGFVRHSERTENEIELIIEAAFEMVNIDNRTTKIDIVQTRRSFDNRDLDTVFIITPYLRDKNGSNYNKAYRKAVTYKKTMSDSELKKGIAFYDNHYTAGYSKKLGLLEKLFISDLNKVRNYGSKNATLSKKSLKKFKFKRDTIINIDDNVVSKVTFSFANQYDRNLIIGSLFIKNSDFTIIESNFSSIVSESNSVFKATGNRVKYSTKIKYSEVDGITYPVYISHKAFKINGLHQPNEIGKLKGTYTLQEVLLNEVSINPAKIINKNIKDREFNRDNLFDSYPYDSSFWNNYSFLLETDDEKQMIKDLEKKVNVKKSLEQN